MTNAVECVISIKDNMKKSVSLLIIFLHLIFITQEIFSQNWSSSKIFSKQSNQSPDLNFSLLVEVAYKNLFYSLNEIAVLLKLVKSIPKEQKDIPYSSEKKNHSQNSVLLPNFRLFSDTLKVFNIPVKNHSHNNVNLDIVSISILNTILLIFTMSVFILLHRLKFCLIKSINSTDSVLRYFSGDGNLRKTLIGPAGLIRVFFMPKLLFYNIKFGGFYE